MPMNDDSAPDHSLPLFLSDDADEVEQGRSSRLRIAGILIAAAFVVGAVVFVLGNPMSRVVAVAPPPVDAAAPDKEQAAQPVVDAQASSPDASQAASDQPTNASAEPTVAEPAAPIDQRQEGTKDNAASGALITQFQAWAQKQNSTPEPQQDQAQESQAQVTQDAPAQPIVSAQPAVPPQSVDAVVTVPARVKPAVPAPVRAAQKPRPAPEIRNARAEMEAAARAKAAHPHGAPARASAADDVRAQETPAQTTQTPSLLQIFGWR